MKAEFTQFKELFIPEKSKKATKELEKNALKWFKSEFNAIFGSTTNCMTEKYITWHYSINKLMFGIPSLGDYHFKFVIKMIHFEHWQLKEWKEGFRFGREVHKGIYTMGNSKLRDANPYSETNFYSNIAWDTGYIMGLSNYKFNKIN